jgi:hypothetical protein
MMSPAPFVIPCQQYYTKPLESRSQEMTDIRGSQQPPRRIPPNQAKEPELQCQPGQHLLAKGIQIAQIVLDDLVDAMIVYLPV